MQKLSYSAISLNFLKYALLLIIVFFLVSPLFVLLSNAFKPESEINQLIPTLIPNHFTLENFGMLSKDKVFFVTLKNSVKVGFITMLVLMVMAIPTGYAMSRLRTKGRTFVLGWILVSQMFPLITIIVPLFLILHSMGLTNTHIGLICVYSVFSLPFSIWMLKGFIDGVPKDLDEAAFIDGCNTWQMFLYILIPVMLPGIATVAIFSFINALNEFFFALILMKSPEMQTVSVKLASYVGNTGRIKASGLAAASLITTLPTVVIFMMLQRSLIKGLTAGASK